MALNAWGPGWFHVIPGISSKQTSQISSTAYRNVNAESFFETTEIEATIPYEIEFSGIWIPYIFKL